MTVGTNNKKQVAVLSALVLLMVYLVYTNVLAGPDTPQRPARSGGAPAAAPQGTAAPAGSVATGRPAPKRAGSRARTQEFRPALTDKKAEGRRDLATIDPTLRLDLFAKVQAVEIAGGARNVFQFAPAPPPPVTAAPPKPTGPEPTVYVAQGPRQPAPPAPPPPPPPPPPITLKFYGFTSQENGKRTAYLLDGEEIYIAAEGDTLKRRYKIVRILPTSILIEDLDAKRQQSVPLTPEESSG
jgi:hypothetical protein